MGSSSKPADYSMMASVPSLRLVSSDATDHSHPQVAFIAQPATAGYPRHGNDPPARSIDRQRPGPPRSDDRCSRATTNSGSRPASRADLSPRDANLERIFSHFKDLQSELAHYKNDLKASAPQGAKTSRDEQSRHKPHKASAMFTSHQEATTIDQAFDPEYVLHARAQLAAQDAYSRELDQAQSFDLPSDYEDDS